MQLCVNFKICGKTATKPGPCWWCLISFSRKELEYVDAELYCPVCMLVVERSVTYPTGCGHTVCVDCFSEIWYPAQIPEVIPEDYGMPSCKNCDDDEQCTCEADWEKWVVDCPEDHARYQAAWLVRNDGNDPFSDRADKFKCPVCRAVV
jgi:hypothetical protein